MKNRVSALRNTAKPAKLPEPQQVVYAEPRANQVFTKTEVTAICQLLSKLDTRADVSVVLRQPAMHTLRQKFHQMRDKIMQVEADPFLRAFDSEV